MTTKNQNSKEGIQKVKQHFRLITLTVFLIAVIALHAVRAAGQSLPSAGPPDRGVADVTAGSGSLLIAAPAPPWGDVTTVLAAYNGYISKFLQQYGDGNYSFAAREGAYGPTAGFWQDAEEIEIIEDMYYWDQANNRGFNATLLKHTITKLASGFTNDLWGADWSGDSFNDDICWAAIAFARAGEISGKGAFTALAVSNLNRVWARARIHNDALHYGLRQRQGIDRPEANVNFGFVTAAYLTRDSSLIADADNVYRWAAVPQYHLLQADGKVKDSFPNGPVDYSYNYGIALNAAVREADSASIKAISNYLRYHFVGDCYPMNGTTVYAGKTLNVLPNYAHKSDRCGGSIDRGGNDVGYDGIAFRGMGLAIGRGYLGGTDSRVWAQGNVALAYSNRNSDNLMWTDFQAPTEATGNYSWNCSSALVGMLVTP
jgi:hypothetical protein